MDQQLPGIAEQLERLKPLLEQVPADSSFAEFLTFLYRQVNEKPELFLQKYQPIIEQENASPAARPFLSVIIRTQGKRAEPLRETLLSLAGQADTDFEILLLGHRLDAAHTAEVEQIIEEQVPDLQEKIRFFQVPDEGRTAPLNFGFAHARGEYAAVLDDDDIALDNWVENFHELAKSHAGKLLHSYVLAQKWEMIHTDLGSDACRAIGSPVTKYCADFDLPAQTRANNCPFMGIAFPLYAFRMLGMIFDETLETTEDWDYIMRCAFLIGVADNQTPAAIYRLWQNAENSQTLHSEKDWEKNRLRIVNKLTALPMLLPAGCNKSLSWENMQMLLSEERYYSRLPQLATAYLYYHSGEGFSQDCALEGTVTASNGNFRVSFSFKQNVCPRQIRFDLTEDGNFSMQNTLCVVTYTDGETKRFTQKKAKHNGYGVKSSIFFPLTDPWLFWTLHDGKAVASVQISGEISCKLTKAILFKVKCGHRKTAGSYLPFWKKPFRLLRKLRRHFRK